MSGHSKWANIKHKKERADAARGKVFSKLAKEMTVAARISGGDPAGNITLRMLISKAKAVNMPNDNIERAIKKGTGELEGGQLEECSYEAYAPGGIGIIIEALTDNKNRAASEIKNVLTKNGANLAQQGAVSRMFQRKGQLVVDASKADEEKLLELALEAGAEDMARAGDRFEILTAPADFNAVAAALGEAGIETVSSEITMIPTLPVEIKDREHAERMMKFVELLEELDDVQNVYPAFEVDGQILAAMENG